jgi:hypothetical protein
MLHGDIRAPWARLKCGTSLSSLVRMSDRLSLHVVESNFSIANRIGHGD